jgi:hypothetical protein
MKNRLNKKDEVRKHPNDDYEKIVKEIYSIII